MLFVGLIRKTESSMLLQNGLGHFVWPKISVRLGLENINELICENYSRLLGDFDQISLSQLFLYRKRDSILEHFWIAKNRISFGVEIFVQRQQAPGRVAAECLEFLEHTDK